MILRKFLALAVAGSLALAAAALVFLAATPATAQEVVQNEGSAYRAWHDATQAGDNAKAMAAAKAYLANYPDGQYAGFLTKWLGTAKMAALDAAIKERRAADTIAAGREILKDDPENVNVLYALALYTPPSDGAEFAKKAIALVEAGKTMSGVKNFDKNDTLGRLTQVLAADAHKNGNNEEAIKLYEKSTALAPNDPLVAAKNLYAIYTLRTTNYGEAAKAWNAIPDADKTGAEPKPEVKEALDRINQESDALVDAAAAFVAYAEAKDVAAGAREKVNQTLEAVYKSRHPEDEALDGLHKLLEEKKAAFTAAPAAPGS